MGRADECRANAERVKSQKGREKCPGVTGETNPWVSEKHLSESKTLTFKMSIPLQPAPTFFLRQPCSTTHQTLTESHTHTERERERKRRGNGKKGSTEKQRWRGKRTYEKADRKRLKPTFITELGLPMLRLWPTVVPAFHSECSGLALSWNGALDTCVSKTKQRCSIPLIQRSPTFSVYWIKNKKWECVWCIWFI